MKKKAQRKPARSVGSTVAELSSNTACWPDDLLIAVGRDLHDGRTVEPILEGDPHYDAAMSYDDRVGIRYRPLDCTAVGFRVRAAPRRIGTGEVARYAKSSCRRCYGLGRFNVERRVATGKDKIGRKILEDVAFVQTCGCADRRYKEAHPLMLIDAQLGEWIALDDLVICRAEGDDHADLPEVPATNLNGELQRDAGVSGLSGEG